MFLRKGLVWSGKAALVYFANPFHRKGYAMTSSSNSMDELGNCEKLTMREIAREKKHHGDGIFINPFGWKREGGIWRLLHWKFFSKNHFKKYYKEEKIADVNIDWGPVIAHKSCSVTFVKHSCVMIRDNGSFLLVDPLLFNLFWFDDFSPIKKGLQDMPKPDHVLITHGHYDHLDTHSLEWLGEDIHVITPLGYEEIFEDLKIKKRTQLDWYDSYRENGREIILLPCNHWTMRNPITGPNRSLWGSFLIKGASGFNIFISGDAACFDRYKELGEEFSIDLAIFNLGAYEPRWFMKSSHMNPAETVKAFLDLKARRLMVVHWGAFRLGDEPVHFPPLDIRKEMEEAGLLENLVHVNPGQTYFPETARIS